MRMSCVGSARRLFAVRALASLVLATVLTVALAVPEAEARRKRHARGGGYNPPFASMVYDVNSGKVLQATNGDAHRHPASVTKVMTLYMLFEQLETGRFKLSTELPVSREAASQAPSKLGLRPGETISVEDAIKALVTKSANDIAVVVAEAIGGDEDRFAAMMTRKARAIGMSRTTFRNASGLPNPGQITTARDLVTLGRVIQDRFPRYYPYFGTRMFTYEGRGHRNHNRLLGQVEGVDGIKTGYTRASGFNLLTSAKADGRHLITVVLGGRSGRSRDAQVAELIENHMDRAYAGRRLTNKTIEVAARQAPDDEDEEDGGTAPARPASNLPAPRVAINAPQPVQAPVGLYQNSALPVPPSRPRTAVIAETGPRGQGEDNGLTRSRPLALAASGSTNIVQSATTPLALVGTTPRSPAMRWVPGPQAADLPPRRDENRLVPPGSVRYTNAIPGEAPKTHEAQPIPAASLPAASLPAPAQPSTAAAKSLADAVAKTEERVPTMAKRAEIAAVTPPPVPELPKRLAAAEPAKEAVAKLAAAPKPAPARSGWIIQLAAAESDAKARVVLDSAVEKTGRLLKSAEPFTEAVAKGGTTLYRARFAGFEAESAQEACKALKRSGFNCIAQKI